MNTVMLNGIVESALMKRSEMINIIWNELNSLNCNDDVFPIAVKILDIQERAGMLPPPVKFKDPGHFPWDEFEYSLNEWEEE